MSVIVTDEGFGPDDAGEMIDLSTDSDLASLPDLGSVPAIRIVIPSFSDGRGFTLASDLRRRGFSGRLRAAGHVLADQFAMARRCGFDEVEISDQLAARQPQDQWLACADWRQCDYRAMLRG
ncbi:hypothetical protein OCGS_0777 [Oceaniovalibus guishaninsula JLT2003]|uniref:Oxidoreductase probably involved in sulfite reduction n=1 Tax=Oceaniovalibus guishaninsula JLT2003 TaxID=1231392 RepID=K2HF14_9RHOB|nr:DUF934 domain-containing protein [Oceaniovalibus guishaninsula]EKE45082.1 hypothetical protein OCGS_0777 [Oceaniovalibus guishaninsula JLT2003]